MGHRAEKTFLRHGFKIVYDKDSRDGKSERPVYVAKKGSPSKNKGRGYISIPKPRAAERKRWKKHKSVQMEEA